ncbi:MAG: serine/threonine-protein kinase [Acidobacteria bacterium]|nr:serine/threonine-protein kinase [Acidobacteriota bacterium]
MQEWLSSGTIIAHYQISSRISANGLGEVYLAKDTSTGRDLALKLFPVTALETPGVRERFIKIFAALTRVRHRNICEIYEGGITENNRPYIAMEYVRGQSMDLLGSGHQLTIDEIIRLVIQIAEALEAAHAGGWLHLAIKPSNLMLIESRRVKVLDFGQALAFPPSLSGETDEWSKARLSTVQYLSPEQVAGQKPDQRSDVYSLGAFCYELIAGHPPSLGSTVDEVIAAITLAHPLPLTDFREDVPPELNRIVAKALAKDTKDRYQTVGEMSRDLQGLLSRQPRWVKWAGAIAAETPKDAGAGSRTSKTATDLRGQSKAAGAKGERFSPVSLIEDLKQAFKSLLESNTKRMTGLTERIQIIRDSTFLEDLIAEIKSNWRRLLVISLTIIGVFLSIFIAGRYLSGTIDRATPQALQITRISASGKVTDAVISPYGERLIYAVDDGGQHDLMIKELESAKEMRLDSDSAKEYRGLVFSPDGRWISYIKTEPDERFGLLFRKSVSGGAEEKLNKGVEVGTICYSPDGKQIAYLSTSEDHSETSVNVGPPEGTGIILAKKNGPSFFYPGGLAWSPDGRVIACVVRDVESGLYLKIVALEVDGGGESTIASGRWSEIDRIAWLGDGRGLVVSATEPASRSSQLWRVAYPSGEVIRITRDLSDYRGASLTYDSSRLVSIQSESLSNIWVAPGVDVSQSRRITTDRFDGANGIAWTPDERIIYVSQSGGRETIWIADLNTNKLQPLPVAPEGGEVRESQPAVSPDGNYIVYVVEKSTGSYLWRGEINRRSLKRLSDENQIFFPSFTADSRAIVYSVLHEGRRVVAKSSFEGGEPVTLIEKEAWRPVVSPYGANIACNYLDQGNAPWKIAVFTLEGGKPLLLFDAPGNFQRVVRWVPDGSGLAYIVTRGGVSNIWRQPLDGGAPFPMTDFKTGRIFDFVWSRDGQRVAFAQGWIKSDAVLLQNFK